MVFTDPAQGDKTQPPDALNNHTRAAEVDARARDRIRTEKRLGWPHRRGRGGTDMTRHAHSRAFKHANNPHGRPPARRGHIITQISHVQTKNADKIRTGEQNKRGYERYEFRSSVFETGESWTKEDKQKPK